MKIVFIGAGNLATHVSQALQKAGHELVQVYSRTYESASCLATLLGAQPVPICRCFDAMHIFTLCR